MKLIRVSVQSRWADLRVLRRTSERKGAEEVEGEGRLCAEDSASDRKTGGENIDAKNPEETKKIHSKVACSLPHNSNYYQREG